MIKGTGIFTGSKTVSFTITPLTTENHTHKEVIDAAVDASCTTPGASQGSHCSVCGAVLEARTYTEPTGHHYVNGVCSDCGDIRYIDKDNLRYTLTDNYLTGQKDLSVSAVPGKTLTGDVSVESGIMFGKATYPVNQIAKNGFADQTSLSSLTFPASIDTIQTGAFTNCTGLKKITFWSPTAPYLEAGAFKNTGTDNFTIQSLELAQAQEVMAEEFEEDTNFVQEYLNAYTQAFGEEFTKDLEEQSDAIYDIAVTMKGENSDGEEITILDNLEILAAEADGSFGVLG